MGRLARIASARRVVGRAVVLAAAVGGLAAPSALADDIWFEGEPQPRVGARIIPCYAAGPTVFKATSSILGSTASVRCVGSSSVSVHLYWFRNGVQVGHNWGGGTAFATTTAGTRCYAGAVYQPVMRVQAYAPNALPATREFRGPVGRFCG